MHTYVIMIITLLYSECNTPEPGMDSEGEDTEPTTSPMQAVTITSDTSTSPVISTPLNSSHGLPPASQAVGDSTAGVTSVTSEGKCNYG